MHYSVPDPEVKKIADALEEYYQGAWEAGVKGLFDKMARSRMGIVTGYLDVGKDTYASLKKKSADSFKVTFKSKLKLQVGLYFANKSDVTRDLVNIGEKVLNALADKIPLPVLGGVITKITGLAANKARDELHMRSITEADKQLESGSGAELNQFFISDTDAIKFIEKSINQYKTIGKYIQTLPTQISSFDDAISFPSSAFKVQQAASSLNVALWSIRDYLESMSERLSECQKVSGNYIGTVRTGMPEAVKNVLHRAYAEGVTKGKADIGRKRYAAPAEPKRPGLAGPGDGGATQLAAYVAHAMAQGYYDSGNTGPMFTTPRP